MLRRQAIIMKHKVVDWVSCVDRVDCFLADDARWLNLRDLATCKRMQYLVCINIDQQVTRFISWGSV